MRILSDAVIPSPLSAAARAGGVADLVEFRALETRDVQLFAAFAGPEDGERVILLHGFPDCWLSWTHQLRALAEAGYRVIAPDQRGYHLSDKPRDLQAYRLPALGGDIVDLLDAAGAERAHLVGHDWGGAVAWWLAKHRPDRLRSVTIANCPHPGVMLRHLSFRNPRQMLRSWYIGFFQLPLVPERALRFGNYRALEQTLRKLSATDHAFGDEELEAYKRAWSQPGALRAMLNWYRAGRLMIGSSTPDAAPRGAISVPVQLIWGTQDKALDASLVEPSAARCDDSRIVWLPEAGHWVHRDCPGEFNDALLDFLQAARNPASVN